MAKKTRSDSDHADEKDGNERVVAAEKKTAAKKVTKKKKSKAKAKKKSAAGKTESGGKPAAAAPPASPASGVHPASVAATHEPGPASPMRGIVALWGPLAIIVLLIVVARIGEDEPLEGAGGRTAVLPASLETAEGIARDVVEEVRDALTGGDPQAAASLGVGSGAGRSSREDLAAAFQDAGAAPVPGGAPTARKSAPVPDPWDASSQTTMPAGVAARPGMPPPYPENPWAPVDPMAPTELSDPYLRGAPPPPGPPPGRGYGRGEGHMPGGGMYPAPEGHYPQHRGGYAPSPGYGERGSGYPRRHAYGDMRGGMPDYARPPPGYGDRYGERYGEPMREDPYAQPYYGEPAPYPPPDYYPPPQ